MDMTTQTVRMTRGGWCRLREELLALEDERRRMDGDDVADRRVVDAGLDLRIAALRGLVARAIPVDDAEREPGVVEVGTRVTVSWEDGAEEVYVLVGPPEVEALAGRISYESPVGRALVGRRVGERVAVATPAGATGLEIRAVEDDSREVEESRGRGEPA